MNFLPATVENGSAAGDGFSLKLPARLETAGVLSAGSRIVLGLRPENILGPGEDARGETSPLRLEVEVVEPLGDEVVVHGKVGDATVICKLEPRHEPEVGSVLDALVEVDEMHVFDAVTEKRLGD